MNYLKLPVQIHNTILFTMAIKKKRKQVYRLTTVQFDQPRVCFFPPAWLRVQQHCILEVLSTSFYR